MVPSQIFSVSLSAKSRIMSNYNECRYMTSSVIGRQSAATPLLPVLTNLKCFPNTPKYCD